MTYSTVSTAQPVATNPWTSAVYAHGEGEYKLAAKRDARINANFDTELWARVFYPPNAPVTKRLPLVVMLHGEHGTCGRKLGTIYVDDRADYSRTGACPAGYRVTPNHLGYDYLGSILASLGYIVVSINANRGVNQIPIEDPVNDPSNIKMRGRLILAHIDQLRKWNAAGGQPGSVGFQFRNRIDFSKVVLFGHSRGGDAIVAATRLAKVAPWAALMPSDLTFNALLSVAPTEAQVDKTPVPGIPHAVLLPMCDGDMARLDGVRFFDRPAAAAYGSELAPTNRWTFAVLGANHNGYNSEWLTPDNWPGGGSVVTSHLCPRQTKLFKDTGVSLDQQRTGIFFALAAIRGAVESPNYAQLLNPAYTLPTQFGSALVDRGHSTGRVRATGRLLNAFAPTGPNGCAARVFTTTGAVGNCGLPPEHARPETSIARIRWGAPATTTSTNAYAKFVFDGGAPINFVGFKTLEMRVAPDCQLTGAAAEPAPKYRCAAPTLQTNPPGSQDVMVILQDTSGRYSNYVKLSDYTRQREAVGISLDPNNVLPAQTTYHSLLSTARMPLTAFTAGGNPIDMRRIAHVWLYLSYTGGRGGLFVGRMELTKTITPRAANASAGAAIADLPRPPRGGVLTPGMAGIEPDLPAAADEETAMSVTANADAGNRVQAVDKAARAGRAVTRVVVETGMPMVDSAGGFKALVDGKPVAATWVAVSDTGAMTFELDLDGAAPATAALTIVSGGRSWHFGRVSLR